MSNNSVGVTELFHLLESNKLSDVEECKQILHDQFLSTKDNWLVNGLFEYYLSTNSLRAIEVLAGVREPHDKYLLDRMTDTLIKPTSHGQRVQVLTILGHIARRQPTWLYKLANHSLFKELLKLLKTDNDTLSMMSALLLLVTLLPMLPAALGPYLNEIFDVFSRLASYHHAQSSGVPSSFSIVNNIDKAQLYLLHLQLGLYNLFHRLYALYPCNLIAYLRAQYSQRDHDATFRNIIKPMLNSVRMHPMLITASKEAETSSARWKKMEHHDIVAECGRFALDRCTEEIFASFNPRATPIPDQQYPYTPVSVAEGLLGFSINNGMEKDSFWSPSMAIPSVSPTTIQPTSHEPRSAPSTPNNNRSSSSPPEAAIEATPETTPVKDVRQIARQPPLASAAVRALTSFGNTSSSRPSTPSIINSHPSMLGADGGIFGQKLNRLVADRQNVLQNSQRTLHSIEGIGSVLESCLSQNGKNDSWNEDQEVFQIVHSQINEERVQRARVDLSRRVRCLRFHSENPPSSAPSPEIQSFYKISRSKSDSNLRANRKLKTMKCDFSRSQGSATIGTQTTAVIPYEQLLIDILDQRNTERISRSSSDLRLSPSSMVDRYIDASARINSSQSDKIRSKKKTNEDDCTVDSRDEISLEDNFSSNDLQLMQMQLLFERQRREIHAERNRRLLGKLRDSRALEEQNAALKDRLLMITNERESLKSQVDRCKKECRLADDRYMETLHHWQSKCVEEEKTNFNLRQRIENLEFQLKQEKKKFTNSEQQTRAAEAAFFDAGHQLKDALKAAGRGEKLKKVLDNVQKRFLLLGEVQMRYNERNFTPVSASRQEAAQIQRAYIEELANLRRQLDTRTSLGEAYRSRLAEIESREARKDAQFVEQQRLLHEMKERHDAELRAVESKYKAQAEINLLLESQMLQLHGTLEAATSGSNSINLASSASPKERSPPLSGSLASSSEGSIAFHSGIGIINDCCDSAGEIANLQAIIEPTPSSSSSATQPDRLDGTPGRANRRTK